ncbi:MAG: hypothetical protein LBR34_06730 [Prevotella sp.]|jgi:hypothetical protein|nr:hypothetical protein [Prevotella sp.]
MKFKFLSFVFFSLLGGHAVYGALPGTPASISVNDIAVFRMTTGMAGTFKIQVQPSLAQDVKIDWNGVTCLSYSLAGNNNIEYTLAGGGSQTITVYVDNSSTGQQAFKIFNPGGSGQDDNALTGFDVLSQQTATDLEINISGNAVTPFSITSVSGLNLLTNLVQFECGNSGLTSALDLSQNLALSTLVVSDNSDLTTLILPTSTSLTELRANNTGISSLNVSGKSSLTRLEATGCSNLTSINLNGCSSLQVVNVSHSSLTALDVSASAALQTLDCRYNQLISLVVNTTPAALANLTLVQCAYNKLTWATLPPLTLDKYTGTASTSPSEAKRNISPQNPDLLPISDGNYTVDLSAHCPAMPGAGSAFEYDIAWIGKTYDFGDLYLNFAFNYTPGGVPPVYIFNESLTDGSLAASHDYTNCPITTLYAEIEHPRYMLQATSGSIRTADVTLSSGTGIVGNVADNDPVVATQYYTLQGGVIATAESKGLYIVKQIHASGNRSVKKTLLK